MKILNLLVLILTGHFTVTAQTNKTDTLAVVKGVTAHRGYSAAYPENTLPAFQGGINAHADWVELDIHKTKDGQIVVSHDVSTKRTSGVNLLIANVSYRQLQEVDVATEFRTQKGFTLAQCPAQRMPLLKEAIQLIMKQKRTHLSIQPKADCVKEAIAIVKQLKAQHMVGFNDASLTYMSQVKELAPEIPVFWDRLPTTNIDEDIRIAKDKGFETLVVHYRGLTAEKVKQIHAANLQAGAWTVDDREIMEKLLKMGIDRIYTDDPKLLIAVKKDLNK